MEPHPVPPQLLRCKSPGRPALDWARKKHGHSRRVRRLCVLLGPLVSPNADVRDRGRGDCRVAQACRALGSSSQFCCVIGRDGRLSDGQPLLNCRAGLRVLVKNMPRMTSSWDW